MNLWTFIVPFYLGLNCGAEGLKTYCKPGDTCWPTKSQWDAFSVTLSGPLTKLNTTMYASCEAQGDNAFNISKTANGACMQYHDCSKEFCEENGDWNIPAYSVEAHSSEDITKTFQFADKHDIQVTVKTSGHNYAGASMGKNSILIWMYHFPKYLDIKTNYTNSCGSQISPAVIKVGGGTTWNDVYQKIGSSFHIVGGGGLTVSAAGGWLQGCGLSAMSRKYGMGIDNVVEFEVVLTNGTQVKTDACHNADLFWALRGGGGGTFGVVTSVHYRLHPVEPIVGAYLLIKYSKEVVTVSKYLQLVDQFIDFWVEESPKLDHRWGGYWKLNEYILYFVGSMEDAKSTFLNKVEKWKASHHSAIQPMIIFHALSAKSYYDVRGGEKMWTDKTGDPSFNIASRIIPRDFVVENKKKTKETLKWLTRNGFSTFNYLLGGEMMSIAANATAVHPAMRRAIWQIETFQEPMIQKLRDVVKDSGAGFNHASKSEPDWRNQFWGANHARLESLKKIYDPKNRLNCWHCIGYQGPDPQPPITTAMPDRITQATNGASVTYLVQLHTIILNVLMTVIMAKLM